MIETERLVLRPWRAGDDAEAEALHRYASDPEIGPDCGWEPHVSVDESLQVINTMLAVDGSYAITLKGNDEPIGSIALKPVGEKISEAVRGGGEGDGNTNTDAYRSFANLLRNARELGYWLGRPHWGRGLTTEAVSALIDYGFRTLRLDAVWGSHYDSNARSGRVMEKCGLQVVLAHHDEFFPLIGKNHKTTVRVISRKAWEGAGAARS